MKAGKIIIYVFLGLFALVFIVGALVPSSMRVEKSIVIDHPPETVFPYGASFEHMMNWNPWSKADADAKNSFEGERLKPGSKWKWRGEKVGIGSMEIQEITPNKEVKATLKFIEPNESVATDIRRFEKVNGSTRVTWINESELSYPFDRIIGLFIRGMLEQNLKDGLANLKEYVDEQAEMNPVSITLGIEGMTCEGCENTIQKRLTKIPGVIKVEPSHKNAEAKIEVDSARFHYPDFESAIEEVGYTPKGIKK
ncbi:MAG: SRPBCC family protein [Bacteroidota bacterium]